MTPFVIQAIHSGSVPTVNIISANNGISYQVTYAFNTNHENINGVQIFYSAIGKA